MTWMQWVLVIVCVWLVAACLLVAAINVAKARARRVRFKRQTVVMLAELDAWRAGAAA